MKRLVITRGDSAASLTAEELYAGNRIRRLRVRDCDFPGRKVTIQAGRIKNKTAATVFLKPATAAELQQYCSNKNKLPNAPVFYLTDKTALMVQFDLRNAGLPYCENGLYFDFHSLRHQCASLLAMNPNTSDTIRQQAMRHKTPAMTRHYSHAFEDQQREAVEALPDLTAPSRESQVSVKTGTDVTGEILSKSCFPCVSGRPNTVDDGMINPPAAEKTQLCENNEGAVETVDPKVARSSRVGLVQKRRLRYRKRRLSFHYRP